MLFLKNFCVAVQETSILHDISIHFKQSELVAITGANGSGKSTLACALMGLSGYTISGELVLDGIDITGWDVQKRAQAGIFLGYQHPLEIPGLSITTFLQHAFRACSPDSDTSLQAINQKIEHALDAVGLPAMFMQRGLHEGFSGGQKKRLELAQILVLEPRIIILDEPDSGLDACGVHALINLIATYRTMHPDTLIILITHNVDLIEQVHADLHLTMTAGKLV